MPIVSAMLASLVAFAGAAPETQPAQLAAQPADSAHTQPAEGAQPRIIVDDQFATIYAFDRPVLKYRHWGVSHKPYVQELYTPAGVNVLLDSPPDHAHHHGLMFAVMVGGVNFWEEAEPAGQQWGMPGLLAYVALRPSAYPRGLLYRFAPEAHCQQRLLWQDAEDKTLLAEYRTLSVPLTTTARAAGATLVTWYAQLWQPEPEVAQVTLTGTHYHGLGLRFVREMDQTGEFDTATHDAGEIVRNDDRLSRGRWCAYAAAVGGKPVTVAMFDHPQNPRPVTWFTKKDPFADMSATLRLHREPLTITREDPLELRYGIALWDGRIAADRIERTCDVWLAEMKQREAVLQD